MLSQPSTSKALVSLQLPPQEPRLPQEDIYNISSDNDSVTAGKRLIRRVDSSFIFGPNATLRIEKKRQGERESSP